MKSLRILTLPFAFLYGFVVFIRNFLYDLNLLPSYTPDIPTISVGNLTVGGSGKTPHIEYIIKLLQNEKNIATLSRGYGRTSSGFRIATLDSTALEIGDEPRQFKQKFKNIEVVVDANRKRGINNIKNKLPKTNLILLDDAFQHRKVKPGLSILLTTYNKLYIDDFILPVGNLREPKSGAQRADIIVVSKTPTIFSPLERRAIRDKLRPKPYQEIFFSYTTYGDFVPLQKEKRNNLISKDFYFERDFSVLLVTGIANSSNLAYYIKNNVKEIKHQKYSDHHKYSLSDIKQIKNIFDNIANQNKIILTTEKDAMRLSHPGFNELIKDMPWFYIPIEVKFHDKDDIEFNNKIIKYARNDKIDSQIHSREN